MSTIDVRGKRQRLKAVLVLGDQNAGKSTLIRHLSGVGRDSLVKLARRSGEDLILRAIVSSVNERDNPPTPEKWAEALLERAHRTGCPNVLLPLRYESKGKNPPAERYYKALAKIADLEVIAFRPAQPGWVVQQVFHVDGDKKRNERAREVRRHLGWI